MFFASVLQKIAGGGVRTHVAGFEVQVLIGVSWVDFAKLQAAGFEPTSRGSKSNGVRPQAAGFEVQVLIGFS